MPWCTSKPAGHQPPFVFIPGWGFSGRILRLAAPLPPWVAPEGLVDPDRFGEELLRFLDRKGIAGVRLVGWSMGAHLALDFACRHPDRVADLWLLAMRRQWPAEEIDAIRAGLAADPPGFLASFYRKCFAGSRSLYRRFQAELEEALLCKPSQEVLCRGLDYLARAESRPAPVPTRLVHGGRDLIVPQAEAADMPGAERIALEKAGHLVFLAPEFPLRVEGWKAAVCSRFSQAADSYDRHAGIQKQAARMLAARLPEAAPAAVLELGCGTGSYSGLLAERYPEARMTLLDFSPAMLAAARRKLGALPRLRFHCEDAEAFLHRRGDQYDLITSNATLQWFADPGGALADIHGLLRQHGRFLASMFGPATLEELRQGLTELFQREIGLPAGRFPEPGKIADLLSRHFSSPRMEEARIIRQYASLPDLLRHIRSTGTAGWQEEPPPVLTRGRLKQLDRWFSERHGGYRVTYQIFLLQGER